MPPGLAADGGHADGVADAGTESADVGDPESWTDDGTTPDWMAPEDSHCPACGAEMAADAATCSECDTEGLARDRVADRLASATKDYDKWTFTARRFPPLALYVAYRQRGIENAQRELHDYATRIDAATDDTVHCRGCGEPMAAGTTACDACGAENELAAIDALDYDITVEEETHDPDEYDTALSSRWWVGVLVGPLMGIGLLSLDPGGASVTVRALALALWVIGIAVGVWSVLKDRKYVRATAAWHPSVLWAGLLWLPGISLVVALVYLAQRYRSMRRVGSD